MISSSNWTEWSTIQGVIASVISKSDEREAVENIAKEAIKAHVINVKITLVSN